MRFGSGYRRRLYSVQELRALHLGGGGDPQSLQSATERCRGSVSFGGVENGFYVLRFSYALLT